MTGAGISNADTESTLLLTDPARFKELYFELVEFLKACGGVYRQTGSHRCARLLYCLDHGMYLLQRDGNGSISQFVGYWRVRPEDLDAALNYQQPGDPLTGDIILTVDFASTLGLSGIMRMFHGKLPTQEPQAGTLCFEHKGRFITYDKKGSAKHPWKLRR